MRIRKIKANGFKSFADSVEILMEPGITAVVGPNGCGKSNISDAMRWVLGEQNPRSLRGLNMKDCLFNGGTKLKPAKRAEVALVFTDTDGKLPIDSSTNSQIEVSRSLTKNGDSNYAINGEKCRLRDISELFMDTGIGVNSYSILEQSRVDQILSTTAQHRRQIFDEVAGITKYKHRKKEATRKLEETEQNIVRINDLIYQLKSDTESLRSQAEQAQLYQNRLEKLKNLEMTLSRCEYDRLVMELQQMSLNLDDILHQVATANDTIRSAEIDLEKATDRQNQLEIQIRNQQKVAEQFKGETDKIEQEIAIWKERQLSLQRQCQRSTEAIESLETQLRELEENRQKYQQELAQMETDCKLEDSRLSAARQVLGQFADRISQTEKSIQSAETDFVNSSNHASKLEKDLLSLDSDMTHSVSNADRLAEQSNSIQREIDSEKQNYRELERQKESIDKVLEQNSVEKNRSAKSLRQAQSELRKSENKLNEIRDNLGKNVSRLSSLEQLQSAHEGFYTGVRAILKAKELDGQMGEPDQFNGVCGVVAELMQTDAEFELAIEVALGNAIQNVVTENAEDAKICIEFLKKHRVGRATFLPLDLLRSRRFNDEKLLKIDGVIDIASQLIDCEEKYYIVMGYLLGNTLIVENMNFAIEISRKYRPSSRLVTLDGEILSSSGAVTGGHNNRQASGLLSRTRELEELRSKVDELTSLMNRKSSERNKLLRRVSEIQEQSHKLTGDSHKNHIEQENIVSAIKNSGTRLEVLREKLELSEREAENLLDRSEQMKEHREKLESEFASLQKSCGIQQRRIDRLKEQLQSEAEKCDEVQKSCQELEIAISGKRERLRSRIDTIETFDKNQGQLYRSIERHKSTIETDEATMRKLSEKIDQSQRRFRELAQDKFSADEVVEELQSDRAEVMAKIVELQKTQRSTRRNFDKLNRMRHQIEVSTAKLQMMVKGSATQVQEKFDISIDEIPIPEEPIDEMKLVAQVDGLRTEISEMGAINMRAIEEYQSHKERYDFLLEQREDLQKSLESTYRTIKRIDETSKEIFMKTFDRVSENFQEVFIELFGGGETELRLTDRLNLLESGVEIVASPPGKRPQTITQLSGGERTLVAIALLFAMFKVKPSPFCVMDEVDAALDDANVLRFTEMLRKYAEQIQFIVITHNKRTMEFADAIYGVTMEQEGISKLVSVKFSGT